MSQRRLIWGPNTLGRALPKLTRHLQTAINVRWRIGHPRKITFTLRGNGFTTWSLSSSNPAVIQVVGPTPQGKFTLTALAAGGTTLSAQGAIAGVQLVSLLITVVN